MYSDCKQCVNQSTFPQNEFIFHSIMNSLISEIKHMNVAETELYFPVSGT